MRQVAFYFHDGCLSQQSILLLARDIQSAFPTWTVTVHRLMEDKMKALGFKVLPVISINGVPVVFGTPSREWLLETIRAWGQ
jgi:hypothetical protein